MKKRVLKSIMTILFLIVALVVAGAFFMHTPRFGKLPEGERLARVEKSPNYRDGKFHNLNPTIQITSDKGFLGTLFDFLFKKYDRQTPKNPLPSMKTDLKSLSKDEDVLIWFGHSSLFVQLDGVTFLIDPVFSKYASPISGANKAFEGSNIYTPQDIPKVDYLIITHDHWDHLDYPTIKALKASVDNIICPLGVGSHLEYWGFNKNQITELDWNDKIDLKNGLELYCLTARHFSGRTLNQNKTLWASFLIKAPDYKFYHSADSGYDTHFAFIGEQFGGVDFATMENGQYNKDWQFIHMLPEETVKAAKDLKTKRAMPIHNSKFVLARHAWDDPMKDLSKASEPLGLNLATPLIGQKVELRNDKQTFEKWWEKTE